MVQTENAVHAVLYLVRVFVNGSVRMRRREMEYRGRKKGGAERKVPVSVKEGRGRYGRVMKKKNR